MLEYDYHEIERICKGVGVLNLEDAEDEAAMILAEVDTLRAKVRYLEAQLAATQVALRLAGNDGAITR